MLKIEAFAQRPKRRKTRPALHVEITNKVSFAEPNVARQTAVAKEEVPIGFLRFSQFHLLIIMTMDMDPVVHASHPLPFHLQICP